MNDDTAWPSTCALSVYNALSMSRKDMTRQELLEFLRASWDPQTSEGYVSDGIDFLLRRNMIKVSDDKVLLIERGPQGQGRQMQRTADDADLVMLPNWGR